LPVDKLRRFVQNIKEVVAKTAHAMPAHGNFIERNCAGPL
jgi:hypothetical protein